MNSTNKLVSDLLELDEVKNYLKYKKLLNEDKKLLKAVNDYKELDEKLKNITNKNEINDLVIQYNELSSIIDNSVIYNLYKNSLDDIFSILYTIKDTIEKEL